jgi:predicted amidohydrolase YtcJ
MLYPRRVLGEARGVPFRCHVLQPYRLDRAATPPVGCGMKSRAYTNGRIITMDPQYRDPAALLVRDGRITVVGTVERVLNAADVETSWFDLEGKALLPGFNDNHFHTLSAGLRDVSSDLTGLDAEGIIEAIKERRRTHPQENYFHGYAWDYPSCPNPHRDLLDPHFPDIPVFLYQFSGHGLWTNTIGLERMGLLKAKKTSGEIVLVDDSGSPTGVVREAGRNPYLKHLRKKRTMNPEKIRRALKTILPGLAQVGITSVQDNTWYRKPVGILRELNKKGELICRFSCWSRDEYPFPGAWISMTGLDEDWIHIGPHKFFADGAFSSHSGWLFEDYSDEPGNSGSGKTADEIFEFLAPDIKRKRQIACHAIGDRAVHELCVAAERLNVRYPWIKDLRFRIEHGQLIHEEDIRRIADLGILVSAQPPALTDPEKDYKLLGEKRAAAAYPFRSLLDAGVDLSFGSDYPGEGFYEPLRGIHLAVNRDGPERISVEEAFSCYTLGSAHAEFREDSKGSITPGKLADLVVLSDDPLSVPAGEIGKLKVIQTLVGGEAVYQVEPLTVLSKEKTTTKQTNRRPSK